MQKRAKKRERSSICEELQQRQGLADLFGMTLEWLKQDLTTKLVAEVEDMAKL